MAQKDTKPPSDQVISRLSPLGPLGVWQEGEESNEYHQKYTTLSERSSQNSSTQSSKTPLYSPSLPTESQFYLLMWSTPSKDTEKLYMAMVCDYPSLNTLLLFNIPYNMTSWSVVVSWGIKIYSVMLRLFLVLCLYAQITNAYEQDLVKVPLVDGYGPYPYYSGTSYLNQGSSKSTRANPFTMYSLHPNTSPNQTPFCSGSTVGQAAPVW